MRLLTHVLPRPSHNVVFCSLAGLPSLPSFCQQIRQAAAKSVLPFDALGSLACSGSAHARRLNRLPLVA